MLEHDKRRRNVIMELVRRYKEGKLTTSHVRALNNMVICLMILVAGISIIWSISIHIISADFYNGFIGAKLAFRERDFTQMDNNEKDLFYHDLGRIINETYTEAALDDIKPDALVMPKLEDADKFANTKPKVRKIAHVFQTSNSKVPDTPSITTDNEDADDESNAPNKVPKIVFNVEKDRRYLAHMTIDIHQTRWPQNLAVQYIYGFPFLSEIVAIVWTAMCLIFQSGVKKQWGLPKPWRIVVPSIIMFTIMTVANLSYLILANGFVKTFCNDLRGNLSKPDAISCGDAMSVLRPLIRPHDLSHQVYLMLFKGSYIVAMILWIIALLIMLLRFILAIDFQMVDIETSFDREMREGNFRERDFVEVLLSSPQHLKTPQLGTKDERHRSEDDFQSAKSHISEAATPLLDNLATNVPLTMGERRT
ncbi:uncharacterized protein LOC133336721 isoform X2 [Musca vetustissima]|uniref:uncharacterized protein LOC133336721 isoform X2 n=1 Tax=Musca vetustissima TaxID=27455 RepID=UPI002AB77188|nr:uncharacterized protein LOC133336721 isoform X2 [Musca vetustissima]